MNDIFRDILDDFVVIYLDNILIYSENIEAHQEHVRTILRRLREHHLVVNPRKSSFFVEEIDFLGHWFSAKGVRMDNRKLAAVQD